MKPGIKASQHRIMGDSTEDKAVNKKPDLLEMLKDQKNRLLTLKEVALLLRVSFSTVFRLVEEGKLKGIRTGARHTLVPESFLKQYLDSLNDSRK